MNSFFSKRTTSLQWTEPESEFMLFSITGLLQKITIHESDPHTLQCLVLCG